MCTFEGKQIRNNSSKGTVNYYVERDVGRGKERDEDMHYMEC